MGDDGQRLPEALVSEVAEPFAVDDDLALDLSYALLVVLERLTPAERAAYLLREIFDHDYADVAAILQRDEAACRQLVHRAKSRIHDDRPRFEVDRNVLEQVMNRFVEALGGGDMSALAQLLTRDVVLTSDGGGKATAVSRPVSGPEVVSRLLMGFRAAAPAGFEIQRRTINGEPGLVGVLGQTPLFTMSLGVLEGRIAALYFVRNPDKLTRALPDSTPLARTST